jgi:hypothetical protein
MGGYTMINTYNKSKILSIFTGAIFAYGQTGTGKTYTVCVAWIKIYNFLNFKMSGDENCNVAGIIQHSFGHIFDHISSSGHEKRFVVGQNNWRFYCESCGPYFLE